MPAIFYCNEEEKEPQEDQSSKTDNIRHGQGSKKRRRGRRSRTSSPQQTTPNNVSRLLVADQAFFSTTSNSKSSSPSTSLSSSRTIVLTRTRHSVAPVLPVQAQPNINVVPSNCCRCPCHRNKMSYKRCKRVECRFDSFGDGRVERKMTLNLSGVHYHPHHSIRDDAHAEELACRLGT